jgi:antitoxin component YwqK of YwqJK toxin-antitoxin module
MGLFDVFKKNKDVINENGLNEIYYDNGRGNIKSIFHKKNRLKDGPYQYYYLNGELQVEGIYKNDKIEGIWRSYTNKGKLKVEENYDNDGKLHIITRFYYLGSNSDHIIKNEITCKNGYPVYYKRFSNNILSEEGELSNKTSKFILVEYSSISERNSSKFTKFFKGDYTKYNLEDGKVNQIEKWKYNSVIKTTIFYNNGNIKEEYDFKKGELEKSKIFYKNGKLNIEVFHKNLPNQYTNSELYKFRSLNVINYFKEDGSKWTVNKIIEYYLDNRNWLFIDKITKYIGNNLNVYLNFEDRLQDEKYLKNGSNINQIINGNLFVFNHKKEKINDIKLTTGNWDSNGLYTDEGKDIWKEKEIKTEEISGNNDQCICIKSRKSVIKINLEIYSSMKDDFKDWVVVDISNRKDVVFTSDSNDECKDWINEDLVLIENKKLSGKHKYIFENDVEYYEGEWKDGKRKGSGVWKDTEYGDSHEGQWKDGKQNGIGTYKDSNGKIITGDWKDGKIEIEDITYSEEGGEILINKKKD